MGDSELFLNLSSDWTSSTKVHKITFGTMEQRSELQVNGQQARTRDFLPQLAKNGRHPQGSSWCLLQAACLEIHRQMYRIRWYTTRICRAVDSPPKHTVARGRRVLETCKEDGVAYPIATALSNDFYQKPIQLLSTGSCLVFGATELSCSFFLGIHPACHRSSDEGHAALIGCRFLPEHYYSSLAQIAPMFGDYQLNRPGKRRRVLTRVETHACRSRRNNKWFMPLFAS